MSEAAPGGEFPESFDENDLFFERPTYIGQAHKLARNCEDTLNSFDGDDVSRERLKDQLLHELNASTNHMGRFVKVSGLVRMHQGKPTTLTEDRWVHSEYVDDVIEDTVLQSFGYRAYKAPPESGKYFDVKHIGVTQGKQISDPRAMTILAQSDIYEIPIDGSATVRLAGEVMPPYVELLKRSVPKLTREVREILKREESLNNKLFRLSRINLEEHAVLHDKGGGELKKELVNYINQELLPYFNKPYHVTGSNLQIAVLSHGTDGQLTVEGSGIIEGIDIVCSLKGIYFSTNTRPRLSLATSIYVHDRGWRIVTFDLDDNLGVIPEEIRFKSPPGSVTE